MKRKRTVAEVRFLVFYYGKKLSRAGYLVERFGKQNHIILFGKYTQRDQTRITKLRDIHDRLGLKLAKLNRELSDLKSDIKKD